MIENIVSKEDINNYGIVYTPDNLVDEILDLIPEKYFKDKNLRWLDIGAGKGAFSINLYKRLLKNLCDEFENEENCKNHIIKNMLFMVEIYEPHIDYLISLFGKESNIIKQCFLSINQYNIDKFDFICGNPPYNLHGCIKTPTNSQIKKTDDGKAVYVEFVNKSLDLLYEGGFLNIIIPSLWLKPDKAKLYNTLTNLKIHKLHSLSTLETCKRFNYEAQIPTVFFLIENVEGDNNLNIYDKIENSYIKYKLKENNPIPTDGISIINKLLKYIEKSGSLKYYKTNTPSKKCKISDISNNNGLEYNFINIKTCYLNNLTPNIVLNYSNIASHYYNIRKLVLAHKMYGFPYSDLSGEYGISTRDNYIISEKDYNIEELKEINNFLSSKFALYIFKCCNYRMRYLERSAFSFIPDITKIDNFPSLLNKKRNERDKIIAEFFNLSEKEKNTIEKNFKNYQFFL